MLASLAQPALVWVQAWQIKHGDRAALHLPPHTAAAAPTWLALRGLGPQAVCSCKRQHPLGSASSAGAGQASCGTAGWAGRTPAAAQGGRPGAGPGRTACLTWAICLRSLPSINPVGRACSCAARPASTMASVAWNRSRKAPSSEKKSQQKRYSLVAVSSSRRFTLLNTACAQPWPLWQHADGGGRQAQAFTVLITVCAQPGLSGSTQLGGSEGVRLLRELHLAEAPQGASCVEAQPPCAGAWAGCSLRAGRRGLAAGAGACALPRPVRCMQPLAG